MDLKASAISHFHTHPSPVTSLYATETKQSDRDRLLLSGSRDGWVYMWDLEYVYFILLIFAALALLSMHSAIIHRVLSVSRVSLNL